MEYSDIKFPIKGLKLLEVYGTKFSEFEKIEMEEIYNTVYFFPEDKTKLKGYNVPDEFTKTELKNK